MAAVLEFRNVTGRDRGFRLEDVSFAVEPGYLVGIAGKNGSGKTTLLHYLLDPKCRYTGSICLEGQEIHRGDGKGRGFCPGREDPHARCMERIAFLSEEAPWLFYCSARENALYYGAFYESFDMKQFLENMKRLEVSSVRQIGKMSRGERMKFQLAFAMAHDPVLYVMDEPTAGMDPMFRREFFRMIGELLTGERSSVLMTTHNREELQQRMDYVGILKDRRLVMTRNETM